jgi:hypothetical protein
MPEGPRTPTPTTPEREGVEGGERDVSTDLQPPGDAPAKESGMVEERPTERDGRQGGMAGEGT